MVAPMVQLAEPSDLFRLAVVVVVTFADLVASVDLARLRIRKETSGHLPGSLFFGVLAVNAVVVPQVRVAPLSVASSPETVIRGVLPWFVSHPGYASGGGGGSSPGP